MKTLSWAPAIIGAVAVVAQATRLPVVTEVSVVVVAEL